MLDFGKIYCQLHPYDQIINFCADESCLVGLCATCVCSHTQMHLKNRTQPQFQNIRTTFGRVKDQIRAQINLITDDKDRLTNVFEAVEDKKENFKVIIDKAKQDCHFLVQQHFAQLQKKWEAEINNEEKKNSVHSNYRLQTMSSLISKEISNLLHYSSQLNSHSFLDKIKQIQTEVLVHSKEFHRKISQELEDNERYTPIVNYNAQLLEELSAGLKKLMTLQFSIPFRKYLNTKKAENLTKSSFISNCQSRIKQCQTPKRETIVNNSIFIPRPSSIQRFNNSIIMTQSVMIPQPQIINNSSFVPYFVQTPQKPLMRNNSQILEKSRLSRFNFGPSYVDVSTATKTPKEQIKKSSRLKKTGLTIFSNNEAENIQEKQNCRIAI